MMQTGEISPIRSFVGVGEPYHDPVNRSDLHVTKGVRQFQTSTPKQGKEAGNWGEQYRPVARLYEGEPYQDLGKLRAQEKLRKREKFLHPRGFVPSSPPKQMTGPGSYEGAFGTHEHKDDGVFAPKPVKKAGEIEVQKTFVTNPPRKGGFGFIGTTLGPLPEYVPDPYDSVDKLTRQQAAEHRKLLGEKKAFRSASAPLQEFDTPEHSATGAPRVYAKDEACLPPRPDPTEGVPKKQIIEKKVAERGWEKPFRQSHPAKSGPNATFGGFTYVPEPYDPLATRAAMLPDRITTMSRKTMPASFSDRQSFKPASGPKTGLTRSIARIGIYSATIGRRR